MVRYSAVTPSFCVRFFVFAMVADSLTRAQDQAAVDDLKNSNSKRKRNGGELKPYHAPWDTSPVHCIDLVSGRSTVDDKTFEQIWDYLKQPTQILAWRSECPLSVLLALM